MKRLDSIADAAVRVLLANGLEAWSLDRVAREAGCAKGLVVHHFGSRAGLLTEAAARLGRRRLAQRVAALEPGAGSAGLEELWATIADDTDTGVSRAVVGLTAAGFRPDRETDGDTLHAAVVRCLGIPAEALAPAPALGAMLDGLEFALLKGVPRGAVRTAFDRLWVTMIEV
ncbi:MAG: TetR family transcriptional regulator [Gemmatimonadales bacterium]